jgi:ribonuclease HI
MRFLGTNTNNTTGLEALEIGLHIAIAQKYERLIMEGDSLILVNTLQHLFDGTKLEN